MFRELFENTISSKKLLKILSGVLDLKNNNVIVRSGNRIDITPKNGKVSGPQIAEELLPKINKILEKQGLKGYLVDVKTKKGKDKIGGIQVEPLNNEIKPTDLKW